MSTAFIDPFEQFVEKRLLVISNDSVSAAQISYFASLLKGRHGDDRVDPGTVRTLAEARDHIKNYPLNIIFIDPAVDSCSSVLDFIQEYRTNKDYDHIVWVVFSEERWWQQNQSAVQKHDWGDHFLTYYTLFKNQSENDLYRDFVIQLTLCHWDFVLKLLDKAAEHIKKDGAGIMSPEQIKKYSMKGMGLLKSLTAADHNRTGTHDAFVSMTQSAAHSSQYKQAMQEPIERAGYKPFFAGVDYVDDQIPGKLFARIRACSLFVGDVTDLRPSVLIEIGFALALPIPVILVRNFRLSDDKLPFLIKTMRISRYDTDDDLKDLLVRELKRYST